MNEDQLRQVRDFNRAVTRRLGVLSDDYLGRGRPLAESRVLFEIGRDGCDVRDLRSRLSLDSGYVSRLLRALEAQGLVRVRSRADDARVRRITLTGKGIREVDTLDSRSRDFARSLLAPLGATQRQRMMAAMAEVERFMRAAAVEIDIVNAGSPVALGCIEAYLHELDERFETGFDPARGSAADADEFDAPSGVFLVARLDGEAVGCGGLRTTTPGIGEIKRMWVAPSARGLGIAQRLLDALERHAVEQRLHAIRLDTNRTLVEARALYERNGYDEIPRYNDNAYAHHWYEKRLAIDRSGRGPSNH